MARTLSRIATNGIIIAVFSFAGATGTSARAESDVEVAPATKTVRNPFSARSQPTPQPTVVPPNATGEPRTYPNPFASRSAAPAMLTPTPNGGSLSRWRRGVELPGIGRDDRPAPSTPPTHERWDTLAPDTLGTNSVEEFGPTLDPRVAPPSPAPAEAQAAHAPPPDPIRFAPSALHQPYWLLPDPTTGETAAAAPAGPQQTTNPYPAAALQPADPFDEPEGSVVLVSDAPQLPPTPQDPARCYADAQQAAATANTLEELGSAVRMCEAGLASQPRGELGKSLRSLAAWASNRRGELKSDDRREDEALREFETAIQFDPNCWLAIHNRAVCRAQQGKADGALADFNRTISLNPGHVVAYRNRGELLAAMGRTEEAVADYSRSLDQLPDDADVLLMRGHALHRLGRYDESLADLNRAIEIAPRKAEAYAHRGNVYAEMGEFSRAVRDFQQALHLDPESTDAYRSLAWLMATCPDARFRDPERALEAAQRAAKLATPDDCFVLDALAAAHANAGQFDQAVRYQKEAVTVAPIEFQQSFASRLAMYEHRRPFRNGERMADGDVRAASLETGRRAQPRPRQQ